MKLSLKGVAVSSLIGAEDIALEELEANGSLPGTPVMNLKNWVRTGVEIASIGVNMASRKEKIREPAAYAFYSNTPLFGKALRDMVKEHLMGGAGGQTSGSGDTNVVVVQPQSSMSEASTRQASPRRGIARNARAFAEAGALTY